MTFVHMMERVVERAKTNLLKYTKTIQNAKNI